MKRVLVLFLACVLTGCFAEDYDVGVPSAILHLHLKSTPLTEATVNWESSSESVHHTIDDLEAYALALDEIKVSPSQNVSIEFKENKKNGGDIWTDYTITATLLKNNKVIKLPLKDDTNFQFPDRKGNYVLKVEFANESGSAQYVGNIVIQ